MSLRRFFTTYTLQFGFILFILGIILTILGIFGVFYYDQSPDFLKRTLDYIGNWTYWCILVGPILLIAGGWYFFDNINKRKEFKELLETTSKAKFIRNQDRVEFLAWKLTPEHQNQLAEKKRKFHIK
ncbi:MAG: DUF3198 domain-containing protein [Thermoplasmata archaeon]|nr:MAG: DUF3198 domain-containing protein [Thermoplasmata archaeon]